MNDVPSDGQDEPRPDSELPGNAGLTEEDDLPADADLTAEDLERRIREEWAPRSGDGTHTALPPKVESWRRRSATGAILTGFAMGLQQALKKKREDPSIVVVTSGDPPDDLPVEADFEYGRPRQSVVNIRPWLLGDPDAGHARLSTSGPDKGEPEAPGDAGDAAEEDR